MLSVAAQLAFFIEHRLADLLLDRALQIQRAGESTSALALIR